MKNGLKYFKPTDVKVIDEKNHIVDAVISTNQIDRDNEIIETEAWRKNLLSYMQHPVLLSSHNYRDLTNQLGQAQNITVGDNTVTARFQYYVGKGNKQADWAWELAKRNMAMFSVGFKAIKWLGGYGNEEEIPDKYEKDDKKPDRVFTEVELLEVSQVLVGSNRGALQLHIENPNIDQCNYMYEVVKSFGDKIPDFENKEERKTINCGNCGEIYYSLEKSSIGKDEKVKCGKCKAMIDITGKVWELPKIDTTGIILPFKLDVKNIKEAESIFNIIKSGRVISEKNRKLINSAVVDMETSIKSLKVLMEATEGKPDETPAVNNNQLDEVARTVQELLNKAKGTA